MPEWAASGVPEWAGSGRTEPASITVVAPAKLTRWLHILGRRADGLHIIEAEMVSLDFGDRLEMRTAPTTTLEIRSSGPYAPIHGVPSGEENLVRRALRLAGLAAAVTLYKAVPAGAGLGGGSSDAAAALRWALSVSGRVPDLTDVVALGADIPFCWRGGRALVSGIGERIQPLNPEPLSVAFVVPPPLVSTRAVYEAFDEIHSLAPGDSFSSNEGNDLEEAAMLVAPELASWRAELARVTGLEPRLAGSGATYFVEIPSGDADREADLPPSISVAGVNRALVVASTLEHWGLPGLGS